MRSFQAALRARSTIEPITRGERRVRDGKVRSLSWSLDPTKSSQTLYIAAGPTSAASRSVSAQPLVPPRPENVPATGSGVVPKSHRKSILLVDPDCGPRLLLTHWLSVRYDVFEAEDGLQALSLVGLMPPPALIVCEVALPNIDGFAVARLLRSDAKVRTVPLVYLTSRMSPEDVARGITAGARRYLFKPFVPDTLCELFTRMIDG